MKVVMRELSYAQALSEGLCQAMERDPAIFVTGIAVDYPSGIFGTTTEAAREIELSTKQQATAVAQVNVAVSNVAQASKETEVSANQTLQTAGQLAGLSRELTRLIQAPANA